MKYFCIELPVLLFTDYFETALSGYTNSGNAAFAGRSYNGSDRFIAAVYICIFFLDLIVNLFEHARFSSIFV